MWTLFERGLDQDWVDSANGFWSVLLLAVLSVGAFLIRYVTQPINCWIPSAMTSMQGLHIQQSCFLNDGSLFLENTSPDYSPPVSYHLWIPLILCLQAVCFKIPTVLWNFGKTALSVNLDKTVASLESAEMKTGDVRTTVFRDAARVLHSVLRNHNVLLSILYLLVKLLFFLNLLGQFIFLTIFFRELLPLKPEEKFLSRFDIFTRTKAFLPKEVMCQIRLIQLQNTQTFRLQCVVPIAEIYQKLFVFLWYYVFLLAVVTIFNLLLWAGFLFLPFLRDSRITVYIKACPGSSQDSSVITRFISGFLGIDGVLLLSMISRNSSEMVTANLIQHLYQVFLEASPHTTSQLVTHATQPGAFVVGSGIQGIIVPGDPTNVSGVQGEITYPSGTHIDTAKPPDYVNGNKNEPPDAPVHTDVVNGDAETINMETFSDTRLEKPLIDETDEQ